MLLWRKIQTINPWFITGIVESEGCFSVSFSFRKKLKVGVETKPSFSISLNQKDLKLIKLIHEFFGCGAIRYSLVVTRLISMSLAP